MQEFVDRGAIEYVAVPDATDLTGPQQTPFHARRRQNLRIALSASKPFAEDRGRGVRGGAGPGTRRRASRRGVSRTDMFHVKHPRVGAHTFNFRKSATTGTTCL